MNIAAHLVEQYTPKKRIPIIYKTREEQKAIIKEKLTNDNANRNMYNNPLNSEMFLLISVKNSYATMFCERLKIKNNFNVKDINLHTTRKMLYEGGFEHIPPISEEIRTLEADLYVRGINVKITGQLILVMHIDYLEPDTMLYCLNDVSMDTMRE